MNILDKILATKRDEVAAAKAKRSLEQVKADALQANRVNPPRDFAGALQRKVASGGLAVIAEFKRASPSAGTIRADLNPIEVALAYESAGATCMSVLTDEQYFKGSIADLVAARAACKLPVIRKDFLVDEYQIPEARAIGADAVLFIIGTLPIATFQALETIANDLGLSVLAEVHNQQQLDEALTLRTPLIGINNRDLTQFVVDLNTSIQLSKGIPADRLVISESGIESADDIKRLRAEMVNAYLIGTALMRGEQAAGLRALLANE
jgi:indole-3-glycerol phosphate synthase